MSASRFSTVATIVATVIFATATIAPGAAAYAGAASHSGSASITLSPAVGPPTTQTSVTGAGFGVGEMVNVYFDTTLVAGGRADGLGTLAPVSVAVPGSAVPGAHWVSAVGTESFLLAQEPFLVRTDWAQFHFAASHRSANPYENVLSPQTVGGLQLAWRRTVGGSVESSPAVAGGAVYVGTTSGSLYAMDAASGNDLWTAATGRVEWSSPAVWDGKVYAGSETGMYAYDADTGQMLWHGAEGSEVHESSPAVQNGVVYVGTWGSHVFAFDAATGVPRWVVAAEDLVRSSPAVGRGGVYVTEWESGSAFAYAVKGGAVRWEKYVFSYGSASAAVARGMVYIGCWGGAYERKGMCAFDAVTGAPRWFTRVGDLDGSTPAVSHGVVFAETANGKVVALDARSGARLWATGLGGQYSDPDLYSTPAVANGVVYVGSANGKVSALDASSGSVLWQAEIGAPTASSPAVADGTLYIGSDNGTVSAYRLPGATQPPPRPTLARLVGGRPGGLQGSGGS